MKLRNKCVILIISGVVFATSAFGVQSVQTQPVEEVKKQENQIVYNIGSTSKMFVTAAVMQLVDEGKIDLDIPLVNYIPDFKMADGRYTEITPRMLLNHSSGLMGSTYTNSILLEDNSSYTHDELLNILANRRLKAKPGQYAVYCNDGFTLAEILVEGVSKMGFTEYLEKNIFEPLGMNNSGTPRNIFEANNQVKTYFNNNIEIGRDYANIIGSGGILSTTEDLCKFSNVFMKNNKSFFSEASLKALWDSEYDKFSYGYIEGDKETNYGLGWDSVELYPFKSYGIKALQKGGDTLYQHGNLTVLPEHNISAAVLSSGGGSNFNALVAQALLEVTLEGKGIADIKEDYKPITGTVTNNIPQSQLDYAGIYISDEKIYQISFPNDEYLEITTREENIEKTGAYSYTEEGYYIAQNDGEYMNRGGLTEIEENTKGSSKVFFKQEADDRRYICAATYENYTKLGTSANTIPLGERVDGEKLNDNVLQAWENRSGNTYYLNSEKYSSAMWLNAAQLKLNLSEALPGYIKGYGHMYTAKIVDETHAKSTLVLPGTIGRDVTDIAVEQIKGNEVIHLLDPGINYISEAAVEKLTQTALDVKFTKKGAKWYKVDECVARKQATVSLKGNASIYVYNHYNECIYTSYMKNNGTTIILPKDGSLVIVGEKDAQVSLY